MGQRVEARAENGVYHMTHRVVSQQAKCNTDWGIAHSSFLFLSLELTETREELDISFPTNLRLLLCFLLFSLSKRAILLPNNISALHPDNPE